MSYHIPRCIWCDKALDYIGDKNRTGRQFCRYDKCARKHHMFIKKLTKCRTDMETQPREIERMRMLYAIMAKEKVVLEQPVASE